MGLLDKVPAYQIYSTIKEDITENGYKNSTTRKVFKYSSPVALVTDSVIEDISEKGYKESTTRKALKYSSPVAIALDSIFVDD